MDPNSARSRKRRQISFDPKIEFEAGTRLADGIINKFLVSDEAVQIIDDWEIRILKRLQAGMDMSAWSFEFYQLHMYCQRMCKGVIFGTFDPDLEFSEFMEIWRTAALNNFKIRRLMYDNSIAIGFALGCQPKPEGGFYLPSFSNTLSASDTPSTTTAPSNNKAHPTSVAENLAIQQNWFREQMKKARR